MERSEPALVPEWLKNAGSLNSGSSISNSDDQTSSKLARNKSFLNSSNGHDFGRSFSSDRTTSSYFRRSSSSNGSGHLRSNSSFGRQHDRDWERNTYDSRERDRSIMGDRRRRDFSEGSGTTLLSKYERDGFRRSHSMVSGKNADTWHKKLVTDSSSTVGDNANGSLKKSSSIGGVKKTFLERDFPSLGAEERSVIPEVGRVPSPGLSSAIQSLPIGSSTIINGEKWTSALAEVPVLVGNNGNGISPVQQSASPSSTSVAIGTATSLNMAEAVAQAPNRGQTTPTLSVGTQRLEELAIKQSRQLIPVTPSTPKTLVFSSSDKQKNKVVGPLKGDVLKASNVGKLHVLKPVREKNGTAPSKDSLSPTSGSKLVSSTVAAPSFSGSTTTRGPTNNPVHDRKPVFTVLEKRPTSQAQSRNEFFNSVRKKSMENPSSTADSPTLNSSSALETSTASSPSFSVKSEMEAMCANTYQAGDTTTLGVSLGGDSLSEIGGDTKKNGDAFDMQKHVSNGKKHPSLDLIFSEEEEAAFLRSMGWEENDADEGGLTEEEINAFFKDVTKYINSKPSLKILKEAQPKIFPFDSHIGGISAGLSSSDAKLET